MSEYADPELLIAAWLHEKTGRLAHADPSIDRYMPFTAPLYHVQRGPGEGDSKLTLDTVLLDLDTYAKDAGHARKAAQEAWGLMRLTLPLHTFANGIFVKGVQTVTAPCWLPATGVYRRGASYRVILHGMVP